MIREFVNVMITIPGEPVAHMRFDTIGHGDVLPPGANWTAIAGWWSRLPTPELIAERVARTFPPIDGNGAAMPQPTTWRIVEESEIPEDRTYRRALVDDGKALVHDMAKAREWHRELLREARAPQLLALDVEVMKAVEAGRPTAAIAAQKQVLRDVTKHPAIDEAATVDELKAVTLGLL